MTFLHPALLAGLLFAGVPVILHLIMRQKPQRVPFPAFRFLARKATANRRKLQLRHLLLLLMRMFLIGLVCLALARPRIVSEALSLAGDRPAAVVLILDTSPSMGYTVAGRSRLDDAKARALEVIQASPAGSRFAVLDVAEPGGAWLPSATAARERVTQRELSEAAGPVTDGILAAYRLYQELATESADPDGPPPRLLYVFTDRAPACWDNSRSADIEAARAALGDPKPESLLIDVGLDKPADLALTELRFRPQIVPANVPVTFGVTVQSTGQDVETQILCRLDGSPDVETKPVRIAAGQSKEITFTRRGLKPGLYRAEVRLATDDALVANNVMYVCFEVSIPRPVLVLCDRSDDTADFVRAVKAKYPCEVKVADDPAVRAMSPAELAVYRAVVLLGVAGPARAGLWEKLTPYVAGGGGVLIAPGGDELLRADYDPAGPACGLMPARLDEYVAAPDPGVVWLDYQYQHPAIAPFREYAQDPANGFADNPPRATRYWAVTPGEGAGILVRYNDAGRHPAVIESALDRTAKRGRVLLFTTPIDGRRDAKDRSANDYWEWWFGLALMNQSMQYLVGGDADAEFNLPAGRPVTVPLPIGVRPAAFLLTGPGVEATVPRPDKATDLRMIQPRRIGQYTLSTPDRQWVTGFSLNVPGSEYQLTPRVGVDTLKPVFGADGILAPGQTAPLRESLERRQKRPVELFPWLMLIVLALFVAENWLANRFYRTKATATVEPTANAIGSTNA
ncbi:MAG: BatA domain-containing protein [Gemmataceae bacterium]|nr:BatA domain-containing protein [Gemmataceae bacterium]